MIGSGWTSSPSLSANNTVCVSGKKGKRVTGGETKPDADTQ